MSVNETQIGGDHYKTAYHHWDLVVNLGMGYLEACATKYVTRWHKKGGVEDLKKAQHYVEKLLDCIRNGEVYPPQPPNTHMSRHAEFCRFHTANLLGSLEAEIVRTLAMWENYNDVEHAHRTLDCLVQLAPYADASKVE